ncbi:MAG: KH domain-containing protein [Patescibacteria group bacterium]|jgi:hypothetical protein
MAKELEEDQAFVEYVVKQIVDNPSDVKTKRTIDEMGVLVELSINQADMGKVIGKEGKTAKAIRTLLRVLGAKSNARINLKIMEPDGKEIRVTDDNSNNVEEKTEELVEEVADNAEEEKAEETEEEKATEIL